MFEEKKCPNCGNPVRNDAVFCLDCGKKIEVDEERRKPPEGKKGSTDKIKKLSAKTVSLVDEIISDDLLDAADFEDEVFLEIVKGSEKGVRIPLSENLLIGRKKRDDGYYLNDPYVSREHFLVIKKESDYYLKNLSRTNGTKVNGDSVEEHKLSHGDVVEAGFTTMTFHSKSQ